MYTLQKLNQTFPNPPKLFSTLNQFERFHGDPLHRSRGELHPRIYLSLLHFTNVKQLEARADTSDACLRNASSTLFLGSQRNERVKLETACIHAEAIYRQEAACVRSRRACKRCAGKSTSVFLSYFCSSRPLNVHVHEHEEYRFARKIESEHTPFENRYLYLVRLFGNHFLEQRILFAVRLDQDGGLKGFRQG